MLRDEMLKDDTTVEEKVEEMERFFEKEVEHIGEQTLLLGLTYLVVSKEAPDRAATFARRWLKATEDSITSFGSMVNAADATRAKKIEV